MAESIEFAMHLLGHVLVRRDPPAARHRRAYHLDLAAVVEFVGPARYRVGRMLVQRRKLFPFRFRQDAACDAMLDDGFVRRSGLEQLGRQRIQFCISLVVDDEPLVAVEHAQALGHVVQGGVEPDVLDLHVLRRPFPLVQLTKVQDRDRQANSRQRKEKGERDRVALRPDALEEGRNRDVDGERAHDIVQAPLDLVRLELIVTAHAALLVGQRRIDRSQQLPVVDGRERGSRAAVRGRGERLDHVGHRRVDGRRRDVAARTPDPAQDQRAVLAKLLVEAFDRMGAERGRDGRVLAELGPQPRVVGHERVDQLKNGGFLFHLLVDERLQAGGVEITRDRRADGAGEDQIDDQNPPGFRAKKSE